MAAPLLTEDKTPINSVKGAAIINGNHTDVVCKNFDDKLFIVLTQYQRLGTLVLVSRDMVMEESQGQLVYSTNVLLGKDEPEHHVIARGLASKIPTRKPILFALGLKETSPQMMKALSALLEEHKCW